MAKLLVYTLSALLLAQIASAKVVKVATWNIENLRASPGGGVNPRHEEDFQRLKRYGKLLNADVIALLEIESEEALANVFDPREYAFFVSTREVPPRSTLVQRTAFVVKKTIEVRRHDDVKGLNVTGNLRHGVDIEAKLGKQFIRLLVVHLKSFCFEEPVVEPSGNCQKLAAQIPVLNDWIDDRADEAAPFIILGDFNRRFDSARDDFWPLIDDGEPKELKLFRATRGRDSECWKGEYPQYIDHIVYGPKVSKWALTGSFEQLLYSESRSFKELLSDHCPIAVSLDVR